MEKQLLSEIDRRISNRLQNLSEIYNYKTQNRCTIYFEIETTDDDQKTAIKQYSFDLVTNHKHVKKDDGKDYIEVVFESPEEGEIYKAANSGAGTRFDIPEELKGTLRLVYNKYTGEQLPDGTYYIPPTYAIAKLRNMLTNQRDFKNNI